MSTTSSTTDRTPLVERILRPAAWRAVRHGIGLVWRSWPAGVLAVAVPAVLGAALPSVLLLLIWRLVNAVSAAHGRVDLGAVLPLSLAIAVITGVQYMSGEVTQALIETLGHRVATRAQAQLVERTTSVVYGSFYDADWQNRLGRVSEDIEWRLGSLTNLLLRFGGAVIGLGGSAALLAMLNGWLATFAAAAALPLVLVQRRNSRTTNAVWRETSGMDRRLGYLRRIAGAPEHAAEVRAYELGGHLRDWHDRVARSMIARVVRNQRGNLRWVLVAGLANAGGLVVSYLVLIQGAAAETLTAGDLFLAVSAFGAVSSSVANLFAQLVDLEDSGAYLDDLVLLIRQPAEDRLTGAPPPDPFPGIRLRDLTFRYPSGHPALDGVSFDLPPGRVVALVGDNGAGKSTLVKLLLRLLDPDGGQILVGPHRLVALSAGPWRERIAVLFQEPGRYETTAGALVEWGRVAAPVLPERRAAALHTAGADGFVARLPTGLDTLVGRLFEGSHGLSGGQWQRLALARVLYRDADLYVLDEPTTGLSGEWEVLQQVRARLEGRAVLLITHRMAAAAQADHIVVLHQGRVAEQGSHEALLTLGGRYAQMYLSQAAQFAEARPAATGAGHEA